MGEVAGAAPVATLEPLTGAGSYIAPTAAFALASLTGEPAAAMAARLTIDPATPLTVEPGSDPSRVTVRPAKPLPAGALVRLRLSNPSGGQAASWAYQVDQAPRVVTTLPGNGSTEVPVDTGIEATFDQDGIVVGAGDITIAPAVPGGIEVYGRTAVFVPTGLKPSTVYTVTVHKGLGRPGSSYRLADDVVWRFRTARATNDTTVVVQLVGQLFDTRPSEPALLTVSIDAPSTEDGRTPPTPQVRVVVARLPNRPAAIDAVKKLAAVPAPEMAGGKEAVSSAGLPVVLRATRPVESLTGAWVSIVRLPQTLSAGWYLITLSTEGYISQAVLQVTDLAPFVALTATRTLAWVNDAKTHRPLAGCSVSLTPGGSLGRTGDTGILDAATPAAVIEAAAARAGGSKGDTVAATPTFVLFDARDGRGAFTVPGGEVLSGMAIDARGESVPAGDDWWHAIATDRYQYRATDTINIWGYVRGRTRLNVPASVEIELTPTDGRQPVATLAAVPARSGVFVASLPVRELPLGWYNVSVKAGGVPLDHTGVWVADIRKPLYRLAVTADRWAALAGAKVRVTVRATFYEGSPAAGIGIVGDGDQSRIGRELTTGTNGTVSTSITATGQASQRGTWPTDNSLDVRAAAPEDGAITADGTLLVFSSSLLVDATATLRGKTLTVDGSIHRLDLARLNAQKSLDAAREADPRGAAVRAQKVTITVTEHWSVATRTGTSYDPITKRGSPVYDWSERTRTLDPVRVTTGADGRIHAAIKVPRSDHSYSVVVSTVDSQKRTAAGDAYAEAPAGATGPDSPLSFQSTNGDACPLECRIGQSYTVRLVGAKSLPRGGVNRYLFLVEQRGLRRWVLSSTPTLTETFRGTDAPSVALEAIWFTGTAYAHAENGPAPSLALDTRKLTVMVTPDAARYEPGGTASVAVKVTGPDGRPASGASIVVAVVDSKLLDVGGLPISDPLDLLYGRVSSGVLAMSAFPSLTAKQQGDGKGSTTGGGDGDARSDFRDALLFERYTTDSAGRATVAVKLSDDLTTWRVAVAAADDGIRGGLGTAGLAVGLPFFAAVTVPPELLASDRPSIAVRAFGSAIRPATTVRFTVRSDTLPMAAVTVSAPASTGAIVPLPALKPGNHRVTVVAQSGTHRDAIVRTFTVVASRLTWPVVQSWALAGGTLRPAAEAVGFSTIVISDAGRGAWLARLLELAAPAGGRADQHAAAIGARDVLHTVFGLGDDALPPKGVSMDAFRTPDGGIAILPYGSADLEMTVRALLAAPSISTPATASWLSAIVASRAETDERRSVARVGLAAIGEPVLAALQARAAAPDVGPRELLWIGLGLAALGDDPGAASIAARVAAMAGERKGIEVRINVNGDPSATADATARFAALAAASASPLAEPALAYARAHPSVTDLHVAEELIAARVLVARAPATAAGVAWTVDGRRTETTLKNGSAVSLVLTPAQRRNLVIEATAGKLMVVARWLRQGAPATAAAADLDLHRTITPAGTVARSDIVRIELTPTYALPGEYRVDELVPSGLVPLDMARTWDTLEEDGTTRRCNLPVAIDGQVVRFAATFTTTSESPSPLCYAARVAAPGTFTWEPATLWSVEAPEDWAATTQASLTIR